MAADKSLGLSSSSRIAAYLLISFAVISAAPLPHETGRLVGEKLLEWTIHDAFPADLTEALTSELRGTQFHALVCPMFVNYTRFNFTLSLLSENDTRHANVSLITFLLEKTTEMSCEKIKRGCRCGQRCSVMECSISSITNLCLGTPTDTLAQGFTSTSEIVQIFGPLPELIQSWMRENLSSKDVDSGTFQNLSTVVLEASRIQCTLPVNGTVEETICVWDF